MVKIANKLTAKKSYSQKAYLGRFPYNLVQSGNLEKYYNLLTNFQFIAEKINHPEFGVDALINDYDLVDDPEVLTNPEYNPHKVRALELIQGALKLSAHILSNDKTQLIEQLWGRLMSFEVPEIQAMLEVAKQSKATPWLRPLTPNLTTPGGQLIRTLTGHSDSVYAVALTPDGKYVISGSSDNTLKVWNLETGQEKSTLTGHSHWVYAVALTSDGKYVISGSFDKTLKVWNLETGQEKSTLTGHSHWVNAVALTSDGKYVISGSSDNTLKIWNLETGQEKSTLTGHSHWVYAVALTPDGKYVISGSSDNTLKIWNLETGQEKSTL
ncbi:WD40 repeat domain-containing protein, partial [Scytonema sp. HK-05]|uniref:WD40 repeat domain-containing protein n=1 Tax=Scytonema sp. HK-05 TaxID=1137095 RepID=UPI00096264A2